MKAENITHGDVTLAIVVRAEDWEDGLNFVSSKADYQQVGIWGYDRGKLLNPHIHLVAPREVRYTQEVVFVRDGRIRADIYGAGKKLVKSVELKSGDAIILLAGGHGYEILDDHTRVLEIKNGPYVGPEKDRERI